MNIKSSQEHIKTDVSKDVPSVAVDNTAQIMSGEIFNEPMLHIDNSYHDLDISNNNTFHIDELGIQTKTNFSKAQIESIKNNQNRAFFGNKEYKSRVQNISELVRRSQKCIEPDQEMQAQALKRSL